MAYKVLGQTTSTAPSTADVIYNQIPDPSLDNLTIQSTAGNSPMSTAFRPLINSSGWQLGGATGAASTIVNVGSAYGITPAFGKECLTFRPTEVGTGNTYSPYMTLGHKQGIAGSALATNGNLDIATAIALKPGTTYSIGYNHLKTNSNNNWSSRILLYTWTGSGVQQGTTTTSYTSPSSVNTWESINTTFSSGSNSYATFTLQADLTTSGNAQDIYAVDGFWCSPISQSTFPNPTGTTVTTAPFDSRGFQFSGALNNSSTVLQYPGALTDLYTTPAGSSAVASTVSVTNMNQSATKIRIAVLPSGQTLAKKHFIVFDAPLAGNTTQTFTIGMTLAAGDKVRVSADNSDTAFTAFGNES
jgi:hypothetical protein